MLRFEEKIMRVLVYGLSSDKLGGIETFLLNMNQRMSSEMVFDYVGIMIAFLP